MAVSYTHLDVYKRQGEDCALPGFVDSKNEEKTERNAGYLVAVSYTHLCEHALERYESEVLRCIDGKSSFSQDVYKRQHERTSDQTRHSRRREIYLSLAG